MLFQTTAAHEELRAKIRSFAEEEIKPLAFLMDQNNEFPEEAVKKLGKLGWMGIPFPKEYGGAGLDALSYAIAVEELARVDVGEVVGIVRFHYGKLVRVLVHIAVQLGIAGQTRILPRPIGNDHSGADKLGDRPIPIRTFFAAIRAVTTGETEQGHKLGSSSSQRLYCAEELLYGHPAAGHNDGARGRCELQPFRILELGQLQNCIGNADIVLRGVFHKIHGGTLL